MPVKTATRTLTIVGALLALALTGGCGGGADSGGATAAEPAGPSAMWIALVDCSASFRGYARDYLDDFRAYALEAERAQALFSYGCVAGRALNEAPPRTIDFSPAGDVARAAGGDDDARRQLGEARAVGAGATMERLLRRAHYGGSDQLAALERASENRRLARLVMWSDFVVNDGDFKLKDASQQEIRAVAKRWTGRVHDLAGVTVLAIGAGRGARDDQLARNAEELMRLVVHGVHGRFGAGDSIPAAEANAG
jgi:hypothetical protein